MPDTSKVNVREAETQLARFREEFQKLRQEFLDDGEIDREEGQVLKEVESIIARVEAQIAEKKTGSDDSETAETEDGDAGREAWEARTSDYRKLIVSTDTLQNEGNPNAPVLTKFLNRIDDAVAEGRWGEAVELLDLAQMTVQSATGGTEGEDADPGAAKWAELAGDYDGVVNEINELRSDEHPDIERFEDFVTQMDRAVREERWNDAISTLDLAQSALGAAGFKPEGAGEGPEASDALAELAEGEAEPSRDGAEAAPSPGTAGETGDESAGDSDTFWADEFNRRYFEAQTLTEASERFTELGYDEADEMSTMVDQLVKASEEERYFDFIQLLDAGLVLMRAINRRHGETPSEDQGGESDWSDRIEDHERLQRQIARLENSEDSDDREILDEIYTFNRLIGKAVADGNYADAIRYLDSALMIIPTSKPSDAPSSDDPAEPTEPGGGGATDDDVTGEDDSEDEWLQMADQLSELQRLMQQLIGAGGNVATGIVAAFTDILKASAERRWEDAVSLLTTALASARQLVEDIGGGDTPAPNTTDPIVPGVTPDGPGGTEPGQINPASASISGSVGKGGKNVAADVQTVQQLLNQNGASPALEVDGMVGPKTNGAISKFQQEALGFQDGRVDPGGQTWGALTSGGGASPSEQPAAGGETGGGGTQTAGQSGGAQSEEPGRETGTATLEVHILDEDGVPVGGATVRLTTGPTKPADAFTDAQGMVRFEGLAEGRYHVNAAKLALVWQPGEIKDGKLKPGETFTITLRKILNEPLSSLTVQVIMHGEEQSLEGVDGAIVAITPPPASPGPSTITTGKDGVALFVGLRDGDYVVSVTTSFDAQFANVRIEGKDVTRPVLLEDHETKPKQEPEDDDDEDDDDDEATAPSSGMPGTDTVLSTPLGALKVTTDMDGNITSNHLDVPISDFPFAIGKNPFVLAGSLSLAYAEFRLNGTTGKVPYELRFGEKGSAFFGLGHNADGEIAAIGIEIELECFGAPVTGVLDMDDLIGSARNVNLDLPSTIHRTAGGSIKAGFKIEAMKFGCTSMLKIREYDSLVEFDHLNGAIANIKAGADYARLIADVQATIDEVLEAVDLKANELEGGEVGRVAAETGAAVLKNQRELEEEDRKVEDQMSRLEYAEAEGALVAAEGDMEAGHQTLFGTPEFLSRANALANKDRELATEIYGDAWTQRALAKQAYDNYVSPFGHEQPIDVLRSQTAQAEQIAGKFQFAISLFRNGDLN